jgi:hypothetical protein
MRKSVMRTIEYVRPFIPKQQFGVMLSGLRGEERGFFREAFRSLDATVRAMPVTYEQSELGDQAVVHLHYFTGGMDWWITEKDMDGGTPQAFGMVDLGHGPELGYISIDELRGMPEMNIDLHWEPVTLAEVKAKKYKVNPASNKEDKKYTAASIIKPQDVMAEKPESGVYH